MAKVLITQSAIAGYEGEYLQVLRQAGLEVLFPKRIGLLTEAELLEQLTGISATLASSEPYTRKVIEAHPQLRVIARNGVGFDAVDCKAATDHGIAVTTTPGTNQDAVAEHAFALMLALVKDIVPQHRGTVAGKWPRKTNVPLRQRTLGIAGLGRIGKSMAVRGHAFGMKLLAFEPYPDAAFASKYGITFVSLERLLSESDFVTLHVPASPESKHFINKKTLALMKPTAYLISTARGSLVNEADLYEALKDKKLAGAGLDVFEVEPVPAGNPLFTFDNVVVTPHAAGGDLQSRDDMALSAAQAIVSLSRNEWPAEKVVNPEVKSKYKW